MLRYCALLLKQTANAPKDHVPLELNPLTRWSTQLRSWSSLPVDKPHLDNLVVGLEGCRTAFNATNTIRTCLFFHTREPPVFLTMSSWRDIANAQTRSTDGDAETDAESKAAQDDHWTGVAAFGTDKFFSGAAAEHPIVALESFTSRSENVLRRRFPFASRLVIGHENRGVGAAFIHGDASGTGAEDAQTAKAASVLYIPQYGTISSLNAVTSLGIALFYAFLDEHYPSSRTIPSKGDSRSTNDGLAANELRKVLSSFQQCFERPLPSGPADEMRLCEKAAADPEGNPTPRVDVRPLHPCFYRQTPVETQSAYATYRKQLLDYSNAYTAATRSGAAPVSTAAQRRTRFGLSVLYENDFDQRNFGGLIRNANAFLVDAVCYIGRRKYNRVGAVGSYHYTPPVYVGKTFEGCTESGASEEGSSDSAQDESSAEYEKVIRQVIEEQAATKNGAKLPEHQERVLRMSLWSLQLRTRVERACGGRTRFWFLDCGHRNLYAQDFDELRAMQKNGVTPTAAQSQQRSSVESLLWYMQHCTEDGFVLSLCDTEETLREAAGDGVVLVVPQEGKLPHIGLLMQCERILTVYPDRFDEASGQSDMSSMRGLPSQVASGIALQRLSVALHPAVKEL